MVARGVFRRLGLLVYLGPWLLTGCGGGGGDGNDSGNGDDGTDAGGTITGTIVDAADPTQPVSDAYVYVVPSAVRGRATASFPPDGALSTHTDAAGSYELSGVPAGAVRLIVEPPAASGLANVELPIDVADDASGDTEVRVPLVTRTLLGTIASVTVDPPSVTLDEGQQQEFSAVVRDTGGAPLPLAPCWFVTRGIGRISPDGTFRTGSDAGRGAVVAAVAGVAGLARVTVGTPPANGPPSVTLSANARRVSPGDAVLVTASASDPDGDAIGCRWLAAGAVLEGDGASVTWTAPAAVGRYAVTCVVDDGHGALAVARLRIDVAADLTPPTIESLTFDHQVGVTGSGTGSGYLLHPFGMFVASDGDLYVADSGHHRIVVFNAAGSYVWEFGALGSSPGRFDLPSDVVVDPDGTAYVADTNNHRVQVFDGLGIFVAAWGSLGSSGGALDTPKGIALGTDGEVLVADTFNDRIEVFDTEGGVVRTWGTRGAADGQFSRPHEVATSTDGEVYVVDRNNHRVEVFDAAGNFLRKWGSSGQGDGQFTYPEGIAVGADGLVYVADTGNLRIQVFDRSGAFLLAEPWAPVDASGSSVGPVGLALTPAEQWLYASGGVDQVQALAVVRGATRTAHAVHGTR